MGVNDGGPALPIQKRSKEELQFFMNAIGQIESGNRYDAVGPVTSSGNRARGKYQIMEQYWDAWATEAGLPGADWKDPNAQERVAAYKFQKYYSKYGRWDAVAVAWFAGPGRANKFMENPNAVGQLKDVTGTSVSKYVDMAMGILDRQLGSPYDHTKMPYNFTTPDSFDAQFPPEDSRPQTIADVAKNVVNGIRRVFGDSSVMTDGGSNAGN